MPYKLQKKGDKYEVINTQTGESKGMSDTRAKAVGHMRALYAVETGTKQYDAWSVDNQLSQDQANYDPIGAGDNKACANCQFFDSPNGCIIVAGDISPTGLSDFWHPMVDTTPMPMAQGVMEWAIKEFGCLCESCLPPVLLDLGFKAVWDSSYISNLPDSAFAYIEPGATKDASGRSERTKRHFPIKDSTGKYDRAHVINAEQRASQSPFGPKAMPKIKAGLSSLGIGKKSFDVPEKIKGWFTSLFQEDQDQMEGLRPVYVTKDVNGGLRATIVFSNNFKDRHDQTIPEAVQEDYLNWLDETQLYPEYQIWHLGRKSRWGQADCMTRSGHFMIASGPVDPGKEELAEAFARDPNTGVSNGYYALYAPGKKEFTAWYPFEISTLPVIASANVWMGAENTLIEEGFLMKDEYKSLLASKGLPPELIAAIDADITSRGQQVTAQGVGSKEVNDPAFLDALATSIGTAIKGQIDPILARLDTIEAGQKAFETKLNNPDDLLATAIQGKIGNLPVGFKASTDPATLITDPNMADGSLDPRFDYLDKVLNETLAQNGIAVGSN